MTSSSPYSTLAFDTILLVGEWANAHGYQYKASDVINALIGPTFSHPDINNGQPYTLAANDVIAAVEYAVGGKEAVKTNSGKFGRPTKKIKTLFIKAGFVRAEWLNGDLPHEKRGIKRKQPEPLTAPSLQEDDEAEGGKQKRPAVTKQMTPQEIFKELMAQLPQNEQEMVVNRLLDDHRAQTLATFEAAKARRNKKNKNKNKINKKI